MLTLCEASNFEEPGAIVPHAGILCGGGWVTGRFYRDGDFR